MDPALVVVFYNQIKAQNILNHHIWRTKSLEQAMKKLMDPNLQLPPGTEAISKHPPKPMEDISLIALADTIQYPLSWIHHHFDRFTGPLVRLMSHTPELVSEGVPKDIVVRMWSILQSGEPIKLGGRLLAPYGELLREKWRKVLPSSDGDDQRKGKS